MSEVTMKSTKEQIFNAYQNELKKVKALEAAKDDPIAEAQKKKNQEVIVSAERMINMNVLAPDIVQGYNDVEKAIEMKKKELQDLYGIEAEAQTFVALINAKKAQTMEMEEKYAVLEAEKSVEMNARIKTLQSEIEELVIRKKEILATTELEHQVLIKEKQKERSREEEEYIYNLKRARKLENDKWADEKAAREKELTEREAAVQKETDEVNAKADYMVELENRVGAIPEQLEEKYQEGLKKGKAEAEKAGVFETRALKSGHEAELKILQAKLEAEIARADKAEAEVIKVNEKLDQAYVRIQELSVETVKSTGGVKILSGENSGK